MPTGTAWGTGTPSTTTTSYNPSGDPLGTTDADANASPVIPGHVGNGTNGACNGASTCTTYDATYGFLNTTTGNAFYQSGSQGYTTTAAGGYGLWPTSTTNENSQSSTFTYDPLGRTLTTTRPGETGAWTTQQAYTVWCPATGAALACEEEDLTQRISGTATVTTRTFYDGMGRPVESRTPGANGQDVIRYALYDNLGNRAFVSDPYFVTAYTGAPGAGAYSTPDTGQKGTTTAYDSLGRVTTTTDQNSASSTTSYTAQCGVAGAPDTGCYTATTVVDADTHQAISFTDALGRDRFEQRFTGTGPYTLYATASYTYDLLGNQLTITAPSGAVTTYTYDALSRKTQVQDPNLGTMTYQFDPESNPTQQADARGAAGTVYVGYDGLNRQSWRSTQSNGSSPFATYTYDSTASGNVGKGELTSETFASGNNQGVTGSFSYTYDLRGRKTAYTLTQGGNSYTMQTGFNDADQPVSTTYPDGDVVTTVYTANDWLSGATEVLGGTTTTLMTGTVYSGAAGANGQPTQYTVGNGLYTMNLGYDRDHRLNSVQATLTSNNSVLYSQNRSFDAAGNTVNQQTTVQGQSDNEAFCYDALNRLLWAGSTGTPSCGASLTTGTLTAAQYTQTYGYDTSWRLTQGPSGSGYTYGDSAHPQAVTSTAGGYTAAYDAAGDMTCRALTTATTCAGGSPTGQTLSYDAERNLLQWQNKPSGATNYTQNAYTGSGDRVWQQVTNGSTTTTTLYLGTAEEIVTTGGTTTVTKYYYAGDRKVAESVGGTITYLVADGLSSVTQALSTTGTVVATQLFAPYGAIRYSSGTMPTAYGFTGTRLDASGLNALGERFYDPVVGQFVSADQTLPGSGAILGGLNRFAYVTGNPETATDPGGEWGFGSVFKAITNVVKAAAPAVVHFVQAAAPVVASVADSALGISSMVGDFKTFFDPNKSWTDKLLAAGDLALNAFQDAQLLTGSGEAERAAEIGAKFAAEGVEHVAEGEAKHLAEKEVENTVEHEAEGAAEKEVIIDTNSVYKLEDAEKLLHEGEEGVITDTVLGELRNNAARGAPHFPGAQIMSRLRVVADDVTPGSLSKLSGLLYKTVGRDGDANIISTALNTGRAVVTSDHEMYDVLRTLGHDVRLL